MFLHAHRSMHGGYRAPGAAAAAAGYTSFESGVGDGAVDSYEALITKSNPSHYGGSTQQRGGGGGGGGQSAGYAQARKRGLGLLVPILSYYHFLIILSLSYHIITFLSYYQFLIILPLSYNIITFLSYYHFFIILSLSYRINRN